MCYLLCENKTIQWQYPENEWLHAHTDGFLIVGAGKHCNLVSLYAQQEESELLSQWNKEP